LLSKAAGMPASWSRVSELGKFIRAFVAWAVTLTTLQSEQVVNECIGKQEPMQMYSSIRQLCSRSIFMATAAYCRGTVDSPDPRLVAHAEKAIDQHFGCYPAEQNRDLEERVLNLIRWANEQP
jgi:hypothetical protein